MTVNNETNTVAFTGNGVTTVFPYTFRIPEDDMGHVGILDIASSVLTELAPADYSIIGVGSDFGGTVTYNPLGVPIPNTKRIVIFRELDLVQEMDLTNQSPYYSETLEETLDRIVMMMQQVSEAAARSIKVTLGSTTSPDDLVAQLLAVQAAAALSAANAATSEANADTSELLAMQWATNPEDDDVTPGLYSAFHWAQKAMAFALALVMPAVPVALNYIRRNAANTAYEVRTPVQTAADISAVRYDAAQGLTVAQQGQARANVSGDLLAGLRDIIINGDGLFSQRTYTTVADDVYWCDRHYVLTQTAAITPTVLTDVADGLPTMMRLTQTQAAAQRMGNAQIVEASVAKRYRGKTMTLGGKLRCSSSQPIRYAVLEWTGAADTLTSDVVAAWTNGTFTPGQFFNATTLLVAATGSITPTAAAITDFALLAPISSACNNLIVFMWTEGTAAQNVTLDMVWGLVEGDCTVDTWPYAPRHIEQEKELCKRYFQRTDNGANVYWCMAVARGGTAVRGIYPLVPEMRIGPALAFIGSIANVNTMGATDVAATAMTSWGVATPTQFPLQVSAAVTSGQAAAIGASAVNTYIYFEAEL